MARIVLVEDEVLLRQLFEQKLRLEGHEIASAVNGKEGWELIQETRPDLILLDLLMPVMSGYDVLTALRAHPDPILQKTPCLVISNSGQINDLNRAYD